MNYMKSLICLLLLFSIHAAGCSRQNYATMKRPQDYVTSTRPMLPHAVPVRNLFQSIKASDIELFKTVFNSKLAKAFEIKGWNEVMGLYSSLWRDTLDTCDVEDIRYDFLGTDEYGKISCYIEGLVFPEIPVIKEYGIWKMAER